MLARLSGNMPFAYSQERMRCFFITLAVLVSSGHLSALLISGSHGNLIVIEFDPGMVVKGVLTWKY